MKSGTVFAALTCKINKINRLRFIFDPDRYKRKQFISSKFHSFVPPGPMISGLVHSFNTIRSFDRTLYRIVYDTFSIDEAERFAETRMERL